MVDVFISYSRATRTQVEPIKLKLDTFGLDCFFDLHQIDGGANFPDVIDRALRDSKAVLCCWSPPFFKGQWSMIECRDALARGIMVPVAVERFEQFAPPADLRQINWFDLVGWTGEDGHEDWNRTLQNLGKLVGRELTPPRRTVAPGATQVADHLADLRATWAAFPAKSDTAAVERLLARVRGLAAGSGLEFEIENHLKELRLKAERRAKDAARAEAEHRAHKVAQAGLRRQAEEARRQPGTVWRDVIPGLPENAVPEMVTIPPGKSLVGPLILAGRAQGDPQQEMRIAHPFALGKYPVTFAEFDAAIAVGAKLEWPSDQGWGRNRLPAINITWKDAQAYAAWLNYRLGLTGRSDAYRLPSEAEWEYAGKADPIAPFSPGAERQELKPVGSMPANGFGLHDMHGTVWEWCEDSWNDNFDEPGQPANGSTCLTADTLRRTVRGGSWKAAAIEINPAARLGLDLTERRDDIGFRLARTLTPSDI